MADTVLLKKIWTEFKIGVLVFTLIPLMHLSGATTTIGKSLAEVKTGDSFSITCTVSDLSGAVIFYQNSVEKGRCEASIIPGFPGVCVPGFSQDITTNISTYSVASANATGEDGTWSCKHSTETSDDLILIVYGFPANSIGNNQAYLPNNIVATTMDGTQLIVNISECVNPAPTINWTFYQDCEGISITPTIVITSTISNDPDIACSPPYSAYKSTIRNTDMTNAVIGDDHCYRVRSLVAYPGTSFMSVPVMFSANVTFTSQSTDSCDFNYWNCIGYILLAVFIASGICTLVVVVWWKIKRKEIKAKSILYWLAEHIFCCCAEKIKSICEKYKNTRICGAHVLLLADVFVIGMIVSIVVWLFAMIVVIFTYCACKEGLVKVEIAGLSFVLSLFASSIWTLIVLIVYCIASCCKHNGYHKLRSKYKTKEAGDNVNLLEKRAHEFKKIKSIDLTKDGEKVSSDEYEVGMTACPSLTLKMVSLDQSGKYECTISYDLAQKEVHQLNLLVTQCTFMD